LKILREIARFLLTAIAVALALTLVVTIFDYPSANLLSFKGFLGFAAISFVCAIAGGAVVGLPALWLATRLRWQQRIVRMTLLGCLVGGVAGALGAAVLFPNEGDFVTLFRSSVVLGAIAGLAAAPTWVLLHRSGTGVEAA
jgi:hypothetical protein